MTKVLVKEAITEFFSYRKITNIFHLPGIHTLPLNQTLETSDIAVFGGRHESHCAFMADGYARASGKIGVVVVTPGPGLGNLVAPCMEAHGDGVPLFILHIDSGAKEQGKGILHEVADPGSLFVNITKAHFSVQKPDDLISLLETAYQTATTERCGPVVISIPHTFFEKKISFPSSELFPEKRPMEVKCETSGLERALQSKKRPVIIGGRALARSGSSEDIRRLCETRRIPFLTTTSGKGVVREDQPFTFGNVIGHGVARSILSESDIAIAIGTRLRDADARRRGVKLKEIIHIDVDDRWFGKNYSTTTALVCSDLSLPMKELTRIFGNRTTEWDLEKLKTEQAKEERNLLVSPGYAIVDRLRSAIPAETITVWDLNLISYWAEYYFPVLKEGAFISPRGISPIFYAVPAAIGAKIARPGQPCFCITGDGSSLPTLAELATVRKHNIPVVFLDYNNDSYGILDEYMVKRYGVSGAMDLFNPDFVSLARSFGIKAVRAKSIDELGHVLEEQVTWTEPFLIEFDYPVFPPPWQI